MSRAMNPSERPPLVPSLVGPTASGKTAVAVALARLLPIEVVSADSRQVYRRLDVGTAKPTAEERAAVPHWMVDVAEPTERFSAARFGEEARAAFEEIRAHGKLSVLVGGSGLYLRAAEEGLFEGPEADEEVRARLGDVVEREGAEALHARLAAVDAETA
ncbi:MAG: tRNA (adenosine(37)-N6)-dimethylallyltransferase MiaA, partial [Gemmatimonadetes bacterium]|nr:tRNA (adenosine(37)-N6)-dimethylallyltransferase MiaA [Gemmatimonadota bacterium]